MKKIIFMLCLALLAAVSVAQADIVWEDDPAILHIGNPPNSGTYMFNSGTEVRPISDTSLGILMNGQSDALNSPILLILGVPNQTSLTTGIASISAGTAGSAIDKGDFSSSYNPPKGNADVYSFLGLAGNNSNSFGNWHDADLFVNGIDATYFGIFEYELSNTGFANINNPINITFDEALPTGTFAVAFGYNYNNAGKPQPFSTPFTESGLTQDGHRVPEPGMLMLFGSGLLGLGLFGRKKFRK